TSPLRVRRFAVHDWFAITVVIASPIDKRIIEVKRDAFFLSFFGELHERILSIRSCLDDVVAGCMRFKHAETIVMSRCNGDILHACILREADPFLCVEFIWLKETCE